MVVAVLGHGVAGGVYVYDMASAHGTFHNKQRIAAKQYVEVHVGDFVSIAISLLLTSLTAQIRRLNS